MPTPPFSPYVYDRVKEAEEKLARTNVAVKRTQEVGCRISIMIYSKYHHHQDMFVDMTKPHPVNPHQEEEAATSGQQETTFSLDQHASPAAQVSTYLDTISAISIQYLQYLQ